MIRSDGSQGVASYRSTVSNTLGRGRSGEYDGDFVHVLASRELEGVVIVYANAQDL